MYFRGECHAGHGAWCVCDAEGCVCAGNFTRAWSVWLELVVSRHGGDFCAGWSVSLEQVSGHGARCRRGVWTHVGRSGGALRRGAQALRRGARRTERRAFGRAGTLRWAGGACRCLASLMSRRAPRLADSCQQEQLPFQVPIVRTQRASFSRWRRSYHGCPWGGGRRGVPGVVVVVDSGRGRIPPGPPRPPPPHLRTEGRLMVSGEGGAQRGTCRGIGPSWEAVNGQRRPPVDPLTGRPR